MPNNSDVAVASRKAEFEALIASSLDLDAYDDPSSLVRKGIVAEIEKETDAIALGELSDTDLTRWADDHVRLVRDLRGKLEQIDIAHNVALAADANPAYAEAVHQRALALSNSFGWDMSADDFTATLQAAKSIKGSSEYSVSITPDDGHGLQSDLQALAEQIKVEAGLSAIRSRAQAFADSVGKLGLREAVDSVTVDAAREWVAADVLDFRVINDQDESREAAVVMLVNAGRVGLYGSELKSQEPALATDLKARMSEEIHLSSIHARFLADGVPAGVEPMRIRANEDALDVVLGCDDTTLGRSVVQRLLSDDVYRGEFARTISEFTALNQDGPFYDAERFWSAQRLVQIAERKVYLKNGGAPELADWKMMLEEVLNKQRRPLSGAEFKEAVQALEAAAREAGTQREDLHEVVGLLAKVHGDSGETLFRDPELRGAYRDGLRDGPDSRSPDKSAMTQAITHEVRERRVAPQRMS
jgi:hypothetical protein